MSEPKAAQKKSFQLKPRHLLLAAFIVAFLAVGALVLGIVNTYKPNHQNDGANNTTGNTSSVEVLKPRGAGNAPISTGTSTPANLPQPAPAPENSLDNQIAAANGNASTGQADSSFNNGNMPSEAERSKARHERRHSTEEVAVQPINVPSNATQAAQATAQPQPKPYVPSSAAQAQPKPYVPTPVAQAQPKPAPQPKASAAPQATPKQQGGSGKKDIIDNLF